MSYEKKLISAIRKQDMFAIEKIFEKIYYEYGKLVGFVISKYVSNTADIEELINDVFLNFSKVLYSIKLDNIKYYLVTQAKNAAINFVKKNGKCKFEYIDDCLETRNDSMFYELVCDMKNCLTDYEINIIVLHSVYCYTFVDLSKKYNKPISTISSIYHRAIRKMEFFYKKGGKQND